MNYAPKLTESSQSMSLEGHPNNRQISEYYLELEGLLDRIEKSATHYQVLGLGRSTSIDDIRSAYRDAVNLMRPSYYGIRVNLPFEMQSRIERASERLTRAFYVLVHYGKRVEYDNSLLRRVTGPLPLTIPGVLEPPKTDVTTPRMQLFPDTYPKIKIKKAEAEEAPPTVTQIPGPPANRRRVDRVALQLPANVIGFDRVSGEWLEQAQTIDVSRLGVAININKRVRHGMVLRLSLPMPSLLRMHSMSDPTYFVYGVVRRIEPPTNGARIVGVEFLGKVPPEGYTQMPWSSFQIKKWDGEDRRRETRYETSEAVGLEYLNQKGEQISREVAVTENLSSSGLRVFLKAVPPDFDYVRVNNLNRSFESRARVSNRYIGIDGFERLCLQFLDRKWPV